MQNLVGIDFSLDYHILLSTMKAALAFVITAITSLFVPPFVPAMLSQCVIDCMSSRICSCSVTWPLLLMILVFRLFTLSHNVDAVVSIGDGFSFASVCVQGKLYIQQSQDHLVVKAVSIIFMSFSGCSHGPASCHQEDKW